MKVEQGMNYRDAFEQVKDTTVFTTHTPVPAGHDIFSHQLLDKYFDSYLPTLDLSREEFFRLGENPVRPDGFNMTAFALRASKYHNAVSKKHERSAERCGSSSGRDDLWKRFPLTT